jgi:hypothetical protein
MICPKCEGKRVCPTCRGKGVVSGARGMFEINEGALGLPKSKPCPDPPKGCGGTGWCNMCDGTGEV